MSENTFRIDAYLPVLQSAAVRIVGSIEDAQDIVQDTFEKWFRIDQEGIENPKSYLFRSLTNNCQSHLRNLKSKNESLKKMQDILPNIHSHFEMDFDFVDRDRQLKSCLEYVNSKLKPLEKGVFILREVFNLDYEVIQEIVGKKADHCRQALSRAKNKMGEEIRKSEEIAQHKTEELFQIFKDATMGNFHELFFFLNLGLKNS
jgi:RNA polymerase sigma-70 factor, ECF subfamily